MVVPSPLGQSSPRKHDDSLGIIAPTELRDTHKSLVQLGSGSNA